MARFALVIASFLLATACGGAGNNKGSKGVPANNAGVFATSHTRNSGTENFGLVGYFKASSQSTDSYYLDAAKGFPDLAADDCLDLTLPDPYASTDHLDAGEFLELTTPGGTLQVARGSFSGQTFYSTTNPSGTHFEAGGSYTLTGSGDPEEVDLGPFSGSWKGSEGIDVTSPDLSAPISVDRFVDLTIQWTSTGGNAPVFVYLFQQDDQTAVTHATLCKFADDGEGVVRSPTLDDFSETLPAIYDGISVFKVTASSFNVGGLEAPVVVLSQSVASAGVTFE